MRTEKLEKINISDKLSMISTYWDPKIVGELNEQFVKLVKFKGEFIWHSHKDEDELFFVLEGKFRMEFRDKAIEINRNEFIIVPKGIEHRPVAEEEVSVMLFEPKTTLNTGNIVSELTKKNPDRI